MNHLKMLVGLLVVVLAISVAGEVFGDFASEVVELQQIIASKAGTDEGLEAQEKLVGLYVKEKMSAEAEAAYAVMLADYAGNAGLAKAVDHVGDEYRDMGDYGKALELCRYVVWRWPEADHAVQSQGGVVKLYIRLEDERTWFVGRGEMMGVSWAVRYD